MLYDGFFKEIFNPETVPEHLEDFLSILLHQKVKILTVLPNDSTRIGAESTLIIMDIVVELADGSIANVECQKLGYAFPGQRAACYSADLLLRQYKRVRGEQGVKFVYKNIKRVYSIIFFETSPACFHHYPNVKVHHSKQRTDSGMEIELLQEYYFIPLDILKENRNNIDISNELDAWLTFLGDDNPEMILRLSDARPQFRKMYEQIYSLCQNTEGLLDMFSEELRILDRNTVQYMIDEMQDKDAQLQKQIAEIEELKAKQKQFQG